MTGCTEPTCPHHGSLPRCAMPDCNAHALVNDVCTYHQKFRVSSFGSWVNDSHGEGGHG